MATSPNYSWPEPDNTDLVKNGALAIRTMGNAIDTTMATMTPKSTYTTKGSIAAATGASTPANLSVGNNGETLVADSSTSTGLRYTSGNPISNPVLNSSFQIAQRGTSIAVAASTLAYTLDRWQVNAPASAATTVSRQATGDTTNLPNIQYCARVQRNSGQTGTGGIAFAQSFETINSIPFAGKTVTISFYARAGANYSPTSNALGVYLFSGTGTDQSIISGYTGQVTVITQQATLTSTWQRFTYTASIGATANELATYFLASNTGTAGTNDYFEITGIQLDIGSVALPFRTNGATIQGELAACRRYLPAFAGNNADPYMGYAYGTNATVYGFQFDVPARVAPTGVTTSGTIQGYSLNAATTITPTYNAANVNGATLLGSLTITAGQGSRLYLASNALILFTGCEL